MGLGIKKAISEGVVKREDLFITSKLWNTYHAPEHVLPAAKRSLQDLGINYFDLCEIDLLRLLFYNFVFVIVRVFVLLSLRFDSLPYCSEVRAV